MMGTAARTFASVPILLAALASTACTPRAPDVLIPQPAHPETLDPATFALLKSAEARVRAALDTADTAGAAAAWLDLGMTQQANGLHDLALSSYERSTALASSDAKAWYLHALAAETLGRREESLASLGQAAALAPEFAPIAWRRGLLLLQGGDLAAAEAGFHAALMIAPEDPAGSLGLSRVALARDQPEEAVTALATVLARDPDNRHAHYLLGTALARLGREDEARQELLRAGARRPEWTDPWEQEMRRHRSGFGASIDQALDALKAGDVASALALLEELHRKEPRSLPVLTNLSLALGRAGRSSEAASILDAAIVAQPFAASLHVDLARARLTQGRLPDVVAEATRALELDPGAAEAHVLRGVVLRSMGQAAAADAALAEAARLDPRGGAMHVKAGKYQLSLGRFEDAAASFRLGLAKDPGDADAALGLAIVAANLGRREEALGALDAATRAGASRASVTAIRGKVGAEAAK